MIRKTILPLAVIVIVVLTGYFAIQLNSSAAYWCKPYFGFDCDVIAQVACNGNDYFTVSVGSWCDGTICRSAFDLYCVDGVFPFKRYDVIFCEEEGACEGEN